MKKTILTTLAILLSIYSSNSQEKFKIYRENETSSHELGIDKFYFVHHTFADSFFMTNLNKQLSYDEMTLILKNIYDGVTLTDKVNVNYEQVEPTTGKLSYSIGEHNVNGEIFIMLSNFNNSTRKFDANVDSKNQLARWYFLRGNKLVYRKDLYSKELEEEKKKGKLFEIVDLYMFDDKSENDELVKPLIDNLLSKESSNINRFYGYIYLSEYYLIKGNLKKSEKAIKNLTKLFKQQTDIPRTYAFIVDMATTELEIMKRI